MKLEDLRPLWIDTDPGLDDALALLVAFGSEDFEVVALSTVRGNVPVAQASLNALYLCERLGWDLPVYQGLDQPLSPAVPGDLYHGQTGLGPIQPRLASPHRLVESLEAPEALCRMARELGSLDVLALGPLTNLAAALEAHADLADYLGDVFVMGGTRGPGNISPLAEFNFYMDPRAVNVVLAQVQPHLIGLDLTNSYGLAREDLDRLAQGAGPSQALAQELVAAWLETREPLGSIYPVHDLMALYAYHYRKALVYQEQPVRVLEEGAERGQLVWDQDGRPALIGGEANEEHFRQYLQDHLFL